VWKPSKKESNIIPVSLRERDFKTIPNSDGRKTGGTSASHGKKKTKKNYLLDFLTF